jgi:hypothetical protein
LVENIADQRFGNRIVRGEDDILAKSTHLGGLDMIATEDCQGLDRKSIRLRISHLARLARPDYEAERVDSQRLAGMSPGQPHGFLRRAIDLGTIAAERRRDLAVVRRGLVLLEESVTRIVMSLR